MMLRGLCARFRADDAEHVADVAVAQRVDESAPGAEPDADLEDLGEAVVRDPGRPRRRDRLRDPVDHATMLVELPRRERVAAAAAADAEDLARPAETLEALRVAAEPDPEPRGAERVLHRVQQYGERRRGSSAAGTIPPRPAGRTTVSALKRILLLALLPALAAACGESKSVPTPKAKAAPSVAKALDALVHASAAYAVPPGRRAMELYVGGDWAVASVRTRRGAYAAAFRLVGGRWRADLSRRVKLRVLGPEPRAKAAKTPQVAAEISAPAPLVESGLWIDGEPLDVKGGGTATKGTIYGAPAAPLAPGTHVAVAYGRTATHGTATAWTFSV